MPKIAITGTIASGKSSLSALIRKRGYHVFDCDEYNSFLLRPGNEGHKRVKKAFPECFKGEELDRKALAGIIFNDPVKREELENILHPLIIEKMLEEAEEYDPFFAEVPLLFENDLEGYFDESVLVVSFKKVCIERLINKGYTRKEAEDRIRNQMPVSLKKKRASKVIYNNGDFSSLEEKTDKLLKELKC